MRKDIFLNILINSVDKQTRFLVTSFVVAIIMITATLIGGYFTKLAADRTLASSFRQQADQISTTYSSNLSTYISILGGFRALWNTQGSFNHQSFLTYTNSLDPNTTFEAGISSFFFAKPVRNTELVTFEKKIRQEKNIPLTYQAFTVHPDSTADIRYPTTYIEPIVSRENSLGADLGTFPERLEAIEYARDQNALASTTTTTFVSTNKPGFLFFLPLYKPGLPTESVTERQKAFEGVIGASFRSELTFKQIFGETDDPYPNLDFQIYQGDATTPNRILYDHDVSFTAKNPRFETSRVIRIQGQTWTILVQNKPTFSLTGPEANFPLYIIVFGLFSTVLLICFSFVQNFRYFRKINPHNSH
jgi:CHASE1-domain containing sensor protein